MISGATIATSFLGSRAFATHQEHRDWTWLAIACFIGVIMACAVILWPQFGWKFDVNAEQVIDDSIESSEEPPLSPAMLPRDLAIYMSRSHEGNRLRLRKLKWSLQAAVILLAIEIGAWVVTLR